MSLLSNIKRTVFIIVASLIGPFYSVPQKNPNYCFLGSKIQKIGIPCHGINYYCKCNFIADNSVKQRVPIVGSSPLMLGRKMLVDF